MTFRAFHLYYHGDLDRLLVGLVGPLLDALVAAGQVERAFFVRFALGGPHLRLRLEIDDARLSAVRLQVESAAAAFFRENPSPRSVPPEQIRRHNAVILASDANEHDGSVYADAQVREQPFVPEVERYGGAARFPRSVDYFVASSARARSLLTDHTASPRARKLPAILRAVVVEALALASGVEALPALLASAFGSEADAVQPLVARGDLLFEQRPSDFRRLIEAALAGPSGPDERDLVACARALAAALDGAPPELGLRVTCSQLHMSANRLGLTNLEEVYLGRVAWRAAREVCPTTASAE